MNDDDVISSFMKDTPKTDAPKQSKGMDDYDATIASFMKPADSSSASVNTSGAYKGANLGPLQGGNPPAATATAPSDGNSLMSDKQLQMGQDFAKGGVQGVKDVFNTAAQGAGYLYTKLHPTDAGAQQAYQDLNSNIDTQNKSLSDSGSASVGRVAGQVLATAPLMPARAFQAIKAGAELLPVAGRLIGLPVAGGVAGGAYGAATNASNDEGLAANVKNNVIAGAIGAPAVALAGAAGSKLATAAGDLWRGADINRISKAAGLEPSAVNNILARFEKAGISPQEAQTRLNKLGPEATLADIDPALTTEAGGLASMGDKPTSILKGRYGDRAQNADSRAADLIDQRLGTKPNIDEEKDLVLQTAQNRTNADYAAAHKSKQALDAQPVIAKIDAQLETAVGTKQTELAKARDYMFGNKSKVEGDTNPVPQQFRGSNKIDDTGNWFLDGDKPVYANATEDSVNKIYGERGSEFNKFPKIKGADVDGNPITVWYKPGNEKLAQKAIDNFSSNLKNSNSVSDKIQYHLNNAEAYGYPKASAEKFVRIKFGDSAVNNVIGSPKSQTFVKSDVNQLHEVRKALDDRLDQLPSEGTSQKSATYRAVSEVRSDVDKLLKQNPEMAAADQKFATAMKEREALDIGYNSLTKPTKYENFEKQFNSASPEEKDAIRKGLRSAIGDYMDKASRGELQGAQQLLGKKSINRKILREAYGDKADEVLDALQAEAAMRHTEQRVAQNSATAERQAVQARPEYGGAKPEGHFVADVLKGAGTDAISGAPGVFTAANAAKGLARGAYNRLTGNRIEKTITGSADILSRSGDARDRALAVLGKSDAIRGRNFLPDAIDNVRKNPVVKAVESRLRTAGNAAASANVGKSIRDRTETPIKTIYNRLM